MAAGSENASISSKKNPIVFFDINIAGQEVGRIKIELFANICPKTAENFRLNGKPVGYKGCPFHRVIKGFMIQGGDFVNGDGTGSMSIYGETFPDENFQIKHTSAGLLSMANSGPNTNGCQFFITCAPAEWLDGKHVVFGSVVEGMKVVRMIENVSVGPGNKPKLPVYISQCGQFA